MNLQPGDAFVTHTDGLAGAIVRAATRSRVSHAGIVIDSHGTTVEAMPHGTVYGRARGLILSPPLTDGQRAHVAQAAHDLLGRGYNWTGLAALAAQQYGLGWLPGVQAKLADQHDLFCSQLIDLAWRQVGFHAFTDGRAAGDVSPGDLLDLALQSGWRTSYLGPVNVAL